MSRIRFFSELRAIDDLRTFKRLRKFERADGVDENALDLLKVRLDAVIHGFMRKMRDCGYLLKNDLR